MEREGEEEDLDHPAQRNADTQVLFVIIKNIFLNILILNILIPNIILIYNIIIILNIIIIHNKSTRMMPKKMFLRTVLKKV